MGFWGSVKRGLKKAGKGILKVGKSVGKEALKVGKSVGKEVLKVAKTAEKLALNTVNKASSFGGILDPKNIMIVGGVLIAAIFILPKVIDSAGNAAEKVGNTKAGSAVVQRIA